jgi:hypothetical protein
LLFYFSLDNEGESCESPLNSDDQADSNSSLTGRKYIFQFRFYSLSHLFVLGDDSEGCQPPSNGGDPEGCE